MIVSGRVWGETEVNSPVTARSCVSVGGKNEAAAATAA
jgi:hypothetical protein